MKAQEIRRNSDGGNNKSSDCVNTQQQGGDTRDKDEHVIQKKSREGAWRRYCKNHIEYMLSGRKRVALLHH